MKEYRCPLCGNMILYIVNDINHTRHYTPHCHKCQWRLKKRTSLATADLDIELFLSRFPLHMTIRKGDHIQAMNGTHMIVTEVTHNTVTAGTPAELKANFSRVYTIPYAHIEKYPWQMELNP